ncbi:MAG: copper amine oxidase N-terminal domain-containing protein [Clostridiales bacterium]|nr:copper amine oxidase N-terminal domain-containing protein [Clostridiales bacterium]
MARKTPALSLVLILVLALAPAAAGAVVPVPGEEIEILMTLNEPEMYVNMIRQEIDPGRGTAPVSINGRTMVPIRAIIEALGGSIDWDGATEKITMEANGHKVEMWLNKTDYVADGQSKSMDAAPESVNGRTLVPLRAAAENVGCYVDWEPETQLILVGYYPNGIPDFSEPEPMAYTGFLRELKEAAEAAGYMTHDSKAYSSDSVKVLPVPLEGFCVAGNKGSDSLNVSVCEFASAAESKSYSDYINGRVAEGLLQVGHFYKEFTVEIIGAAAGSPVDTAIMDVFASVGWGK